MVDDSFYGSLRSLKIHDAHQFIDLKKFTSLTTVGEMTITAVDSAGGTYFVTKITSRKVTVTQGTGTQFATGASVPWSFSAPTVNQTLQVPNA